MTTPNDPALRPFSTPINYSKRNPPRNGDVAARTSPKRGLKFEATLVNYKPGHTSLEWEGACTNCGTLFSQHTPLQQQQGLPAMTCQPCRVEWAETTKPRTLMAINVLWKHKPEALTPKQVLSKADRTPEKSLTAPQKEAVARAKAAQEEPSPPAPSEIERMRAEIAELRALLLAQAAGKVPALTED